ncbi:hypothetical protein BH10PSE11_BH10PSE11_38540 [soil metagenome]
MPKIMLSSAVALVALLTALPASAASRHHHHRHGSGSLYAHNYGPPVWPNQAFAYYDGPLSARCKQSAAAYRGQDGRRHPCN